MDYYKNNKIEDSDYGSYQEKYLDIARNWDEYIEKKKIKILIEPSIEENISFEDKINNYIEENKKSIKIIDIKYNLTSVMIIFEPLL
tara:strand:- start:199 stop:459 length:261 start_codon:yes stop_codon:yes gene_type:complete